MSWIHPTKYCGVWWEMIVGKSSRHYTNDNHYETNPKAYTITKKTVKAGQTLKLTEAPGGGFAVSLIAK